MPDTKKIAFTVITVFVIPVLFFVLLEFGLAVFGVGKSFDYFHEIEIDGRAYYQENPDFADQFYPPSLGIGPRENTLLKERGADSVRVFVLGGSAAMGFPHRNHGVDRLLEAQLRAALPARQVEVVNTAMTSVNSHVVYEVARTIPENAADFAIILMGNNEVVGPYGPGTFNQGFLTNISAIRGIQSLKRTRIWQALDGLFQRARSTDAQQELKWEGMQMFTEHGVPHDDPRMAGVYSHYEDNLVDIIQILRGKGVHVVLSSVPVNLRHSAPFLSVRSPGLSREQIDQWREATGSGARNADEGNWGDAVTHFEAALEIDPDYADTHFRLATAYENVGEFEKAKSHYERALELDALRFRADAAINRVIHDVAASEEDDAVSFVDSAAAFEQASEPFQPGWNLLFEHVHFDFPGNHILASEFARAIAGELSPGDEYVPLSSAEVARRIGFPNHETIDVIENLQGMVEHPPFPGQSNYAALRNFLAGELARITEEVGSPRDVVERRQDIVNSGLADWKVHFELAALARNLRHPPAAYLHLNRIFELYPHNRESYMIMAEMMSQDGKWRESIPYLEKSLAYTRGDETKIAETAGRLGTAHLRSGQYEEATEQFLKITKEHSDQIGLALRAYGNLVKHARDQGRDKDLERYVRDAERYGRSLVRKGKDQDYPLLYQRMSQIMTMADQAAAAQEWAQMPAQ